MMRKERMFNQGTMLNNVALSGRIKNKVIKIVCGYEICIVELSCLSILHLIGKNEMIWKKNDIKIKKQLESLLKNRVSNSSNWQETTKYSFNQLFY